MSHSIGLVELLVILLYLLVTIYLGWLGYIRTKTASDYLIAGRGVHPFVMALSYGATFISTSAIVGFGGVAGLFGMSLLWLVFLNIFVGIFIAFIYIGTPARRMGHHLDAHTFPELLGRRYQSKFIQVFTGIIIFLFIPLYAAAVIIGGCEFVVTYFGMDYNTAILIFTLITACYVIMGGLKGVMYTDALQGAIMFIGMIILLVFTYSKLGGLTLSHETLTSMSALVPDKYLAQGHRGWTATPAFGFGDHKYDLWWIVFSTITFGVGFGVLAQPQLAIGFMTVKSRKELNRAVPMAGLFILIMVATPYIVGSLSNVYFAKYGQIFNGRVIKTIDQQKGYAVLQLMEKKENGTWADIEGKTEKVVLTAGSENLGENNIVQGRGIAIANAGGNPDQIIPRYINDSMPKWFGLLFLLTLLSAAMSTLSSQFHVIGTSIGRDIYEQLTGKTSSIAITRIGIIIGIVIAVLWCFYARGGYIIARATAIFFGLCLSSFLPAFIGGLFFKKMTKAAAIWSMIVGFFLTSFWLLFVKAAEASSIGLVQKSILADFPNWPVVDPIVVALPISTLTAIIVSIFTKKPDQEHINRCFQISN